MSIKKLLRDINLVHLTYQKKFPINHWDKNLQEKIKNNLTYHSNKIEGLTLTYGETIDFLKTQLIKPGSKLKDIYDLENHRIVLDKIFKNYETIILSESGILSLHAELMKDPAQWEEVDSTLGKAGEYKKEDNFTYRPGLKVHQYMNHEAIPAAINNLVNWLNHEWLRIDIHNPELHPISLISIFHYRFLNEIHPFANGNGRMARLLTTLLLLKKNYPTIIIKADERQKYFKALIDTDEEKNNEYIITFFAERVLTDMEKKLKLK